MMAACSDTARKADATEVVSAKLTIEGMTCEMGCARLIEENLSKLAGMQAVEVDFESNSASISFNAKDLTQDQISATIQALHGGDTYNVTAVEIQKHPSSSAEPSNSAEAKIKKQAATDYIEFPNIFGLLQRFLPAS